MITKERYDYLKDRLVLYSEFTDVPIFLDGNAHIVRHYRGMACYQESCETCTHRGCLTPVKQ